MHAGFPRRHGTKSPVVAIERSRQPCAVRDVTRLYHIVYGRRSARTRTNLSSEARRRKHTSPGQLFRLNERQCHRPELSGTLPMPGDMCMPTWDTHDARAPQYVQAIRYSRELALPIDHPTSSGTGGMVSLEPDIHRRCGFRQKSTGTSSARPSNALTPSVARKSHPAGRGGQGEV